MHGKKFSFHFQKAGQLLTGGQYQSQQYRGGYSNATTPTGHYPAGQTVYVIPTSARVGNDIYLYETLPRTLLLLLSIILFLFAIGLLMVEVSFDVALF